MLKHAEVFNCVCNCYKSDFIANFIFQNNKVFLQLLKQNNCQLHVFCKILQSRLFDCKFQVFYTQATLQRYGQNFRVFERITEFLFFQLHIDLSHREITPYYNSVLNTTIDVCGFFNGTVVNPATKWFFDTIAKTFPKFPPCPIVDEFKVYNLSINTFSYMFQFLVGNYRAIMRSYDENDENIITMYQFIEVKNRRGAKFWDWKEKNVTEFKVTG